MKEKKKIRKLEFAKETVARLGDQQLGNLNGGTAGPGPSINPANACTMTTRTKGPRFTCNIALCGTVN